MKLLDQFYQMKHYAPMKQSNDIFRLSFPSFLLFLGLASLVLMFGHLINFGDHYFPLDTFAKKLELVLALFLIWMMKWLLVDLSHPLIVWKGNHKIKAKWKKIDSYLKDASRFLQATFYKVHDKQLNLANLPWFLIIGPHHSGKTNLFTNANIKYILAKRSAEEDKASPIHFWATRHAIFAETRGDDLGFSLLHDGKFVERESHDSIFRYFLYWLNKKKKAKTINGVILTLPATIFNLSEKMQKHAAKRLIERLNCLSLLKQNNIPVYIVITQCDRLSGFVPFFHSLSREESEQLFGIQLPKEQDSLILTQVKLQFEKLIKQINQQLIYKLHHETNVAVKPFIKEFPLELEQLKRSIFELVKRLQPALVNVNLEGIYLTSATQEMKNAALGEESEKSASTALVQYREVLPARSFFVKSLFTQLPFLREKKTKSIISWPQKLRLQYVLPLITVMVVSSFFAVDFFRGLRIENKLTETIAAYQKTKTLAARETEEQFTQTLIMLDRIKATANLSENKKGAIFSFYTKRALNHARSLYFKTVDVFLLPTLYKGLEAALTQSNNYNVETVYAMLKSYLMFANYVEDNSEYLYQTLSFIEPFHSNDKLKNHLGNHILSAFKSGESMHYAFNQPLVDGVRRSLWYLSKERLAYIILANQNEYFAPIDFPWIKNQSALIMNDNNFYIPALFSAKNITAILTNDVLKAAKESIAGNTVLGFQTNYNEPENLLIASIRNIYMQAYAHHWEKLLQHILLKTSANLTEWENNVTNFAASNSSFQQFLEVIFNNTNFEPITTISAKLKSLNALLDNNQNVNSQFFYQIQKNIVDVHNYVKPVLLSKDRSRASFEFTSKRLQDQRNVDPLTQLRLLADKSPEPIKSWLNEVANQLWSHLMVEAGNYINLAWQERIGKFFTVNFASRYPFETNAKEEVNLAQFKLFFGTSGYFVQFYRQFLDAFIDYEEKTWRWKKVDNKHLAFSDDILKQIQLGLRIHDAFFPNGDDEISVKFAIKPRKWNDALKQVMIKINEQKSIDSANQKEIDPHLFIWPNQAKSSHNLTSIQFLLGDQKKLTRRYKGDWGLFRLVDETFDTMLSKNEWILDLSPNEYSVKYVMSTDEPINPFSTIKLAYFHLPEKLT